MDDWMKRLFRRIDYPEGTFDFENLPQVMKQFALHIPFENFSIIQGEDTPISMELLQKKLIDQGRGGVCYELNPLFCAFLQELGWHVQMIAATVNGNNIERTHIAILLEWEQQKYIVDVGFGANLALQPIPLTGEWISSITGQYRVVKSSSSLYELEKAQDGKKVAGYRFSLDSVDITSLDRIRKTITTHPRSPFRRAALITQITEDGYHTLTPSSYTTVKNGIKEKQAIEPDQFQTLCFARFGLEPPNRDNV